MTHRPPEAPKSESEAPAHRPSGTTFRLKGIEVRIIPQSAQRYQTTGDWFLDLIGNLHIRVTESADPHETFLTTLHEIVEAYLCFSRGISDRDVDDFDFHHADQAFRDGREPGDMEGAPYRREHRFACLIEHLVAHELGLLGYGRVE